MVKDLDFFLETILTRSQPIQQITARHSFQSLTQPPALNDFAAACNHYNKQPVDKTRTSTEPPGFHCKHRGFSTPMPGAWSAEVTAVPSGRPKENHVHC